MARKSTRPPGRMFIPSASFMVRISSDRRARPQYRLHGKDGHHGTPELYVSPDTPRSELLRLLAAGELLLKPTRN